MTTLKRLLDSKSLRAVVLLVAGLAWFAISNHCTLGAFDRSTNIAARSCHAMTPHHAPAKKQQTNVECCKVLRATLAKSVAAQRAVAFAIHKYFVRMVWLDDEAPTKYVLALDTGPPFAYSFSETVLQRSILTHAPPSLA